MDTLSFEPLISFTLWLTLLAAAVVFFVIYAWRRPGGMSRPRWTWIILLSATGTVLVFVILLNPTWIEREAPPGGKPLLTIAVDATESMATPDALGGKSRWQEAVTLAQACADQLGDRFDIRLFTFADQPTATDRLKLRERMPTGKLSDLASAIAHSVDANRTQGQALLLLSDGIHNAGGGSERVLDAVQQTRAQSCRIYTHTLGGDTVIQDVAVEFRAPLELAFVGQKVPISVRLRQRAFDGARAEVVLRQQDKEIAQQETALLKEVTETRFEVSQDKPGLYRYEVRVAPLPGEISTVNNTATFVLRVVNEPVRLLLLEGKPYWDAKFLVRTILGDPSIELDSVVRMSENRFLRRTMKRPPGDKGEITPVREEWKTVGSFADPAQAEWLRQYQIVVLGRDAEVFLNDAVLAQLRSWLLNDGGCLVCYRGKPTALVSERLGQLLPVRWTPVRESRFRVELTDRGQDLRWFGVSGLESAEVLGRLPTLATTARAENPRPLATVVATAAAPDQPVLSYQPVGSGRVVVIEGSGMWRWAFLPPQQQAQGLDDVYRALWHNLLRWAVSSADLRPGQQMALRSDKVSFNVNEPASATLLLRDEKGRPPTVELKGAGLSEPRLITPVPLADEVGAFRVNFGKLPEGWFQARAVHANAKEGAATECAFDVRSFSEEQLDLKARPDLMARTAQLSGGSVVSDPRPAVIAAQIEQDLEAGRTVRVHRLSAWDRWWVLLGGLGLWTATWTLRRRSGLV